VKDRLLQLIEALNLNVASFSKLIGVSDGTTRMYVSRGSKPSSDFLEKVILSIEQVNSEWLITGKGEMFKDKEASYTVSNKAKGNSNVQAGQGVGSVSTGSQADCERRLEAALKEIEYLKQMVQEKERYIQLLGKEEKR